jgi:hypothetical protein
MSDDGERGLPVIWAELERRAIRERTYGKRHDDDLPDPGVQLLKTLALYDLG